MELPTARLPWRSWYMWSLRPAKRYCRASGHSLVFTFEGLVIASVLYSLPFAVQPFAASFTQIDRRLLDAAALLGASRGETFRRVIIPIALGGIIRGVVLSFAHTVGEF